jgi:hypothetical protein
MSYTYSIISEMGFTIAILGLGCDDYITGKKKKKEKKE